MKLALRYFLFILFLALGKVYGATPDSTETDTESYYSTALLDVLNNTTEVASNDDGFKPLPPITSDVRYKRDSIASAMQALDNNGRYADQVPDRIESLPIGIRKVVGNLDWTLMLTNMTVGEEGATISAYLRVITPQGKTLMLGAEGVKLNSDGGISDMKLVLLGVFEIPMGKYRLVLHGGNLNTLTGQAATPMTYAIVGCQGLKQLNLVGEFELSNQLVLPVNPSTMKKETDPQATVSAPFALSLKDWNDLVIQLSLPSFEMKGLDGVAFNIRNAVLDLSDTRNAPAMAFPAGYQNKYYSGNSLLWRGVYISQLDIVLPEQFAKKGNGIRPSFQGVNMIIDQQGVSGIYGVQANILSLGEGSASGWKFSVNKVVIELEANRLTKGGFGGELVLPVSTKKGSDATPLNYTALITDQDEYFLTVGLKDTMEFGLFAADVFLHPNSYVTLAMVKGDDGGKKFKPLAVLTGDLVIDCQFAAKISFTELRLMTEAPYVRVAGIQYTNQNKMSNFPVSISAIGIGEKVIDGQNCLELMFTVAVNIEENKIKGNTTLSLSAYYDKAPGESTEGKWKFYKFRVYEVNLQAEFSALKVKGTIIFMQDDPIYGNGFYGQVSMTYNDKFTIASEAIFGAKTFRYWYVYARIDLPQPITVVGPFMLGSFGGGAYSKMTLAPRGSRIPYVPDETAGFGVKALVGYVIAKKEVCKGDLMFEMCFNSTGGVRYIAFYGSAEIVAGGGALGGIQDKLAKADDKVLGATEKVLGDQIAAGNVQKVASTSTVSSPPVSSIFAYIGIQYNFETSTLEANSEIFINLGMLHGRGANNRAGWMALHVSPERWYCYAGTPEDRLGIVLNMKVLTLETGSYFMVGSEMPTFPDPPAQVVRILGPELYPVKNNISEGSLASGAGFAFGVDLSLHASVNFFILYANMSAGVGGDLMLRQYPDAHCAGSNAPLGINNWYANGRVYTYLEGEIGVQVDLMFIHARIPIIQGAAAAMLEGGGPNPTWAKGYLRVVFSVLGGKVSGDMNMKMSLGDECVIVNNSGAPVSFKIISDVTPVNNATEVDVFTYPQVAFNVAVDEAFEVNDDSGRRLFRVKITKLDLTSGNRSLTFAQTWTNKKQTLTLTPDNTLPSVSTVQLKVNVSFEEYKNNNWQAYVVNGKSPVEEQVISFRTSQAPSDIPHRNIAYMYPAHQQKNVYKEENKTGYVVLKQWQDYLLDADTKNNQAIKLTAAGKPALELIPTLNRSEKKIAFDVSSLQAQMNYTIELVSRPKGQQAAVTAQTVNSYGDSTSGQYTVAENKAETVVKDGGDKSLLLYGFTTSKYSTLTAKLSEINGGISNKLVYLANGDYVNVRTRSYELFDSSEVFGSSYTGNQPLLSFQSLQTDSYYMNAVFPKLYKDFPYSQAGSIQIKNRDINQYGFPPVKALYHDPEYELDPLRMPYIDGLTDVYRNDYRDMQDQLMNKYVSGNYGLSQVYPQFFSGRFPEAPLNTIEQIEFQYVLPGSNNGSKGIINYKR